jgi:adenylate kinase family enzyme
MLLEKKLYQREEVGQIIESVISEIVQKVSGVAGGKPEEQSRALRETAEELLPQVEAIVALEIAKRHVQGVTFSVWAGPPGSGKGTNIDTVSLLGSAYAEVISQGGAEMLEEPFHSQLLQFSVSQTMIMTGTKGMFNKPEGEYEELFGPLVPVFGKMVADGGFVPDDAVSVLVELMILYRLVQNFHRIQIDLWPRTGPQFAMFERLGEAVRQEGGKVYNEIVVIKVVAGKSLEIVRENPIGVAKVSEQIAERINQEVASDWYRGALDRALEVTDPRKRFAIEDSSLERLFGVLGTAFDNIEGGIVLEELRAVCKRMSFRFMTMLDEGGEIRPDAYPLSVIRRLSVYTGETAPAFLRAVAQYGAKEGFYIVSSAGTPQEVIAEILETLAGKSSDEQRWKKMKKLAGDIAEAVVYRRKLIVSDLVQQIGGILRSV